MSDDDSASSSTTFDLLCSAAENFCASATCGPCAGSGTDVAVLDEILERDSCTCERNATGTCTGAFEQTGNGTDSDAKMAEDVNDIGGSNKNDDSDPELSLLIESHNSLLTEEARKSKSQHQRRRQNQPKYRGLENLGNTCYINSSLQVLMTLDSFVDDVVSRTGNCGEIACGDAGSDGSDRDDAGSPNLPSVRDRSSIASKNMALLNGGVGNRGVVAEGRQRLSPSFVPDSSDSDEEEKKEKDIGGFDKQDDSQSAGGSPERPLHVALGNIFTNLRNAGPSAKSETANRSACVSRHSVTGVHRQGSAPAVNPSDFKSIVDSLSPQFVGFEQQDSHEFLGVLLDLLDEEVKTRDQAPKATSSSNRSGEEQDDTELEEETQTSPLTGRSQSPQKRKRIASPSPSLVSEDEDNDNMPRTRSFADLTMEGISSLLDEGEEVASTDQSEKEPVEAGETKTVNEPTSPVEAHFATEIRTTLQCNSCMFSRSKSEMFRCLSLDVAATGTSSEAHPTSVEECLQRFFATEKREVKCEKCFFDTATQKSEIVKLPRALLLHFKRFIVNVSSDYSSVSYRKDARQVEFCDEIVADTKANVIGATSLAEYLASDCGPPSMPPRAESAESEKRLPGAYTYRLRGIVNHIGKSANQGHYTAVTFTGVPKSGDKKLVYTKFNDECVVPISAKEAMGKQAQTTAYILLYELSETKGTLK
jgi:ubiquitin C-terminal hydrolase